MEPPPSEDAPSADAHVWTMLLFVASTFELVSAALVCAQGWCQGLVLYAVVVGSVSLALLAPIALVLFAEPLAPPRLHEGRLHLSLMLLAWWVPATFVLTFVGPFQGLCNGYFASVGGTVGAFQLCRAHVPAFDTAISHVHALARGAPRERTILVGLAVSSTVCKAARARAASPARHQHTSRPQPHSRACPPCARALGLSARLPCSCARQAVWVEAAVTLGMAPHEHPATKCWALIVGLVSFIMCAVYLFFDQATSHRLAFAILLATWWVQGIALSFVPTSFISTLNGFIATWASAVLAVYFTRTNEMSRELAPVPSAPPDEDGLGVPTTTYVAAGDPHVVDPSDGFSRSFDGLGGSASHNSAWAASPPPPPPAPPSQDL